jgi:hypothetical protein
MEIRPVFEAKSNVNIDKKIKINKAQMGFICVETLGENENK